VAALSAGKTSQAKADFNAVIAGDPSDKYLNNNIAYYDLGVIAQTHGDNAVAETDYKGAILLDPHYVAADYNLAILEAATDPQGAITLYRQVLVLSPSDVNAIYNLGLLLIQGGQTAEGEQYLNQAIKIDPSLIKKVPAGVTP
jgi:tetratricopeptide (TPR) repeat protein